MKKRIKVLNIIGSMGDGGAQRIVLNYLKDFKDDNDIEFKLLVYRDKTNSYCNKIIESYNYNADYLFKNVHNKYLRKTIELLFGRLLLIRYFKKFKPDIVHVHITSSLSIFLKPILYCNIPVRFDTLHSYPYRNQGKTLNIIRKAFQSENFIGLCVTNEQVKYAIDHYGGNKYYVLHNGIKISDIKSKIVSKKKARNQFGLDDDAFVVGAVGRLNKIKRYDFLLKVFVEVLALNPKSILVIAGDGPEKENLLTLSHELGINEKVAFLGNVDDVVPLYCAMDILTITSESESCSLTLLESQVCNLRSVISNGVPDESIVTDLVCKMKNNSSVNEWAKEIINKNFKGSHSNNLEDYDDINISKKLKKIYLQAWKEYITQKGRE